MKVSRSKIHYLFTIVITCIVSNVYADDTLGQIYQQNSHGIKQLKQLSRLLNTKMRPIGVDLDEIDLSLLVLKQKELNYIFDAHINPSIPLPDFGQVGIDSTVVLLHNNKEMLSKIPELFERYQQSLLVKSNSLLSAKSTSFIVRPHDIFQQYLTIERLLNAFGSVTTPSDVYKLVLQVRSYLPTTCVRSDITYALESKPVTMGKRPRDVYGLMYDYIAMTNKTLPQFNIPKEPGRVSPQDVFDLTLVAMSKTSQIQLILGYNRATVPLDLAGKNITPSHVYREVAVNILIVECLQNVYK